MNDPKQSGNIPATHHIVLESIPDQWQLFANGLTKELTTTGIIVLEDESDKKIRVSIKILDVKDPNIFRNKTENTKLKAAVGPSVLIENIDGIIRVRNYVKDELDKKTWFMIGYIEGRNKIPIIIIHHEALNYTVYSVVKNEEEKKKLFPLGMDSGMN